MSATVEPVPVENAPAPPEEKPAELEPAQEVRQAKLRLCLPTYRDTFVASAVGSIFLFAGLTAWSISEASLPGVTKHRWFVLLFRMLGWAAVYFIPVQYVSVGNLRGFCLYGAEPGNSSLICWRVALGPQVISEYTEEKELQPRRFVAGAFIMLFFFTLSWTVFFLVYLGPEYEHPGFVLSYGIGHILIIALGEGLSRRFTPPALDEQYAQKMGPATLGAALLGFFVCTTAFSCLRRFVASAWLGILMPAMLSCYELGNLVVLQRTFLAEFVTQRQVRRQYLESNQAILVSAQICMVHAMAEGARMTLILSDMSHAKEQNFEFLVPILSGVAWNVMVRAGMLDRALAILTCGRRTPTRCSLLLQEVKYCMGYPRFFVILAIVMARICARNPILPIGHENSGLAVIAVFLAEILEDLLSFLLEWLDVRVHPQRRQITEAELQLMAKAQLRFSIASDGGETTLSSVLPSSTWAQSRSDNQKGEDLMKERSDLSVKEKSWKLREQFAFSYGEADWDVLPFWAHVASVCIAQFHSLLFMILLGNGLNYVLGYCHGESQGFKAAILWWPVTDPDDLCGG